MRWAILPLAVSASCAPREGEPDGPLVVFTAGEQDSPKDKKSEGNASCAGCGSGASGLAGLVGLMVALFRRRK